MKKKTKILTAIISAAVVATSVTLVAVNCFANGDVSPEQQELVYQKEMLEKQESLGVPIELKTGRYYYKGDVKSGFYIEATEGCHINYILGDYDKCLQYCDEFLQTKCGNLPEEEYRSTVKTNVDELVNPDFTDGYVIQLYERDDSDQGYTAMIIRNQEPYSNYLGNHSGPAMEYIDENTIKGAFDADFIYVAQ